MKVFLDECIDWRLARDLSGHEIKTARQMNWTAIKNGELLRLVAQSFDVFVTVDRNLAFQQNVSALTIAVIVIRAKSNRLGERSASADAPSARRHRGSETWARLRGRMRLTCRWRSDRR